MPYAQNRMNAFFEIQEKRARLLPIEVVTLGYTLFTALLIFYFWPQMEAPWRLLMGRAMIVIALGGIWGLNYHAHFAQYFPAYDLGLLVFGHLRIQPPL